MTDKLTGGPVELSGFAGTVLEAGDGLTVMKAWSVAGSPPTEAAERRSRVRWCRWSR